MECNKDEALKAKELAEKKMQNNDFEGAQKVAAKAQRLYPDLENINQLLAVCNVHCSAKNMLGLDKDWYGILQVDRSADEVTIKKQYRKLALVLHPDKNKFPGAEAAFKLIGEANVLLSDQTKRSIYDSKCRVSIRSTSMRPPPHQVNPPVRPNFFPNGFTSPFSGQNHYQKVQSTSSVHETSFWTTCPFCSVRFQYRREIVNRAVCCQNCLKSFIAYDLGYQGVPTGIGLRQPSQPQQRVVPNQGTTKTAANTAGFPFSHREFQHGSGVKCVGQEPGTQRGNTSKVFEDLKAKEKHGNGVNSVAGGMRGAGTHKVNEWPQDCRNFKNKSRKRSRKQASESSESFDTSSSSESEDFSNVKGSNPAGGQGHRPNGNYVRRSSRRRQDVSYNEAEEEDDQINHPKIVPDSKPEEKGVPSEQNLQEGNINAPNVTVDGASSIVNGAKKIEVIDCESDSEINNNSAPMEFAYPDQEFHDFDKEKEEKCFAVDQLWACYDNLDGMPRYYAHITQVVSPGFSLRFNWLEVDADKKIDIIWTEAGLPVGCGKFKRGGSDSTDNLASFSHKMPWAQGKKKGSYIIYPRKGEIWALYKGWDISWSFEPSKHQPFKYEIVEVLSDFSVDDGIKVGYLNKLDEFVSVFQRTSQGESDSSSSSFLIKHNELYRFSHKIPSFRLTGTEREGVPEGSFELDLASIPQDPNDLWYPLKEAIRNVEPELKRPGKNGKTMPPKKVGTPNKSTDCKEVSDSDGDGEMCMLRKSPRASKKR
ncbi:PREDICTED: uncharacterized protein LOC109159457 [Ipomoea nil]|uniref:uncharacterized protein LOC109159457 n=1 Tax=Ipomoea nil TaxID=35883 RepID=UPI000900AB58|nr:PREDICTED: uncharacterized protein LOC109159457 [Ipomoea nil]XP_019163103.1 PREDICTED: uncharacterized protein LOC109159457 [Ipomoea nil]